MVVQSALAQLVSDVRSGLPRHVMMQHVHKSTALFTFTQVFPLVSSTTGGIEGRRMPQTHWRRNTSLVVLAKTKQTHHFLVLGFILVRVFGCSASKEEKKRFRQVCSHFLWMTTDIDEGAP